MSFLSCASTIFSSLLLMNEDALFLYFQDLLTDLTAHESEKFSFDDMTAVSAHDGMLTAAKKLQCKLLGRSFG